MAGKDPAAAVPGASAEFPLDRGLCVAPRARSMDAVQAIPLKSCLALLALLALALPAFPHHQGEAGAQEQSPEADMRAAVQRELDAIQLELAADPAPEPPRRIRLLLKEGDRLQELSRFEESVTSYERGIALARERK